MRESFFLSIKPCHPTSLDWEHVDEEGSRTIFYLSSVAAVCRQTDAAAGAVDRKRVTL